MAEVSVRQLSQDTARVLARVRAGEHLAVTEHGRVVAHIVPAAPAALADRIATGAVLAPTLSGRPPCPTGPVRTEQKAESLLSKLREESPGSASGD